EEAASLNLFETGKLDLLTVITPTEIPRLEKKGVIAGAPMAATNFLSFNLKQTPFDQLDWRKAVAASIDREGLGKALSGLVQPTTNFLPSTVNGFAKLDAPNFKAQQERIRKLADKPKIHIGYASSGMAQLALQKIQYDLHKELNVDVILDAMEQKVYFDRLNHKAAPPVFFLGNASLNGEPDLHFRHFIDDPVENGNSSNYHSDKYESLYKKIQKEPQGLQRTKLIQQALHVLQDEDVVVIPVFERRQFFAISPQLRSFHVNPASEIQFHRLRWAN
ncbi:MAG: ABC transporter substrate-binding protein, partial [Bdellovibrionales bacterium]